MSAPPKPALTGLAAALYVMSGVTQPLLMTLVRQPLCLLPSDTLSVRRCCPPRPACGRAFICR